MTQSQSITLFQTRYTVYLYLLFASGFGAGFCYNAKLMASEGFKAGLQKYVYFFALFYF